MRRLPALVAALLLPATTPNLLATAVLTGALLVSPAPAQAQSAEAVAKAAEAITVRIEGATQGSGVLVKRDGNRYTVITAWHVVSDQGKGEELEIFTPDGQRHQLDQGSIKRLGQVDMAVLTFTSSNSYVLARVGDVKSVSSGDQVLVAGFPLGANGKLKYDNGKLVANAAVGIDQGYQLLYTNDTIAGMSGGVVLKADGTLIGMHGRGELDIKKSQESGITIKTGTNQGVPISYYKLYEAGAPVVASSTQATTADDYLAQAKALLGTKGREQEVIRLSNQVLARSQSADAYFYRAYSKYYLGDKQGAISDYSQVIAINPKREAAYNNRGSAKQDLGDNLGATNDYNQAIDINSQFAIAYSNRCSLRVKLGDKQGAISDCNQAIAFNPQNANSFNNRGVAKRGLGDTQGAIADYSQAIAINPKYDEAFRNRGIAYEYTGDLRSACMDWRAAASLGKEDAADWVRKQCK